MKWSSNYASLIGAVVGAVTCALSFGQTGSVTFIGYPKTGTTTCVDAARVVGTAFAKASSVELVAAKCLKDQWFSYDIQILYTSQTQLSLVVSPEWPVYRTRKACETAIVNEEIFFTEITGLSPFFHYCSEFGEARSWERTTSLYTPFFYALGKPKRTLKSLTLKMNDGGNYDGQSLLDEIKRKSISVGLPLVQVYMDAPMETKNYDSFLRMRFADSPEKPIPSIQNEYMLKNEIEQFLLSFPWLLDLNPMRFESLKECEIQKRIVTELFSDRFTNPVAWFCMWDYSLFRAKLYHLRIRPGEESFERITPGDDGEPFANEYASFEDCEKDKPKIVAHYRLKLGKAVVGALCSTTLQTKSSLPSKAYVYLER